MIYVVLLVLLMWYLPDLTDVERRMVRFRLCSVKDSTRRLRLYQWRCYEKFCLKYGLKVFPCTPHKLSLYVSEMSRFMKISSIKTYIQGVMFVHKVLGLEPPSVSHPHVKTTLSGIDNLLGSEPSQKDPIFLHHLSNMRIHVDPFNHEMILTWIASLLMFRCLLRVGQVVKSPHSLRRCAVEFTDFGFVLSIVSSKTSSARKPPVIIPVNKMSNNRSCIVYWLKKMFDMFPMSDACFLFSSKKVECLTYNNFSKEFEKLLKLSGIVGNYASHSLRRGGATSMSQVGIGVSEIKRRGRWRSACVNHYIKPSMLHCISTDQKWVKSLSASGLAVGPK